MMGSKKIIALSILTLAVVACSKEKMVPFMTPMGEGVLYANIVHSDGDDFNNSSYDYEIVVLHADGTRTVIGNMTTKGMTTFKYVKDKIYFLSPSEGQLGIFDLATRKMQKNQFSLGNVQVYAPEGPDVFFMGEHAVFYVDLDETCTAIPDVDMPPEKFPCAVRMRDFATGENKTLALVQFQGRDCAPGPQQVRLDEANTSIMYAKVCGEGAGHDEEYFALNYVTGEQHLIGRQSCWEGECKEEVIDKKLSMNSSPEGSMPDCGSIVITRPKDKTYALDLKTQKGTETIARAHFLTCVGS